MKTWWHRHGAKPLLILLLALPALTAFLPGGAMTGEQRKLAAPPALPHTWPGAVQYTAQLEAWVNDHFGMRERLVAFNNRIRYALFRQFPTQQVIEGQEGRIFLAAHQKTDKPYSAIIEAFGGLNDAAAVMIDDLNAFEAASRAHGVQARVVIVPSSPAVHVKQLPPWLARRYQDVPIPAMRALDAPTLQASIRHRVYVPFREMRADAEQFDVFPRAWFHWSGTGPRKVAGYVMENLFGESATTGTAPKTTFKDMPSDLSHMFPGVSRSSRFEQIDYAASGIDACLGPSCFGALEPIMAKLYQMAIFRNPAATRGRLVFITDSFGMPAAPWYARYYKEVLLFSTNNFDRLNAAEMAQVRALLFRPQAHDDVLFLYHDVTVYSGRIGEDGRALFPPH
ncbi:MAG: hypothetical protein V4582_24725 [Pseudomonadota bacterium]